MATRKSDVELEDLARTFLKGIGLEYQVCPDLMTIITKVKHADSKFNYARVPDSEMLDKEAYWYSEESVLAMRESVFIGMQRNEARSRMTVSHELSHYLLKHKGLLNRSLTKTIREVTIPRVRQQESEARRLAAVLLAPEYLIPEGATADDIANMFNLSAEAAAFRKEEVDSIRRRRKGERRPLPKSVAGYLEERRAYTKQKR
jgi:Zn-dependent peptidase ImmA (M78 family)